MKNTLLYLFAATLVSVSACKKQSSNKPGSITNQQAALMVATALASNANGFMAIKNDAVIYAKTAPTNGKGCGVPDVFAAARQDAASATIEYNYAMGYQYTINCVGDVKDNLTIKTSFNGSFDATGLSALDAGSCTLTLTDLTNTATNSFTINGTYDDAGSYHTTDDAKLSGDYSINFTVSNYKVLKANNSTTGGSATVNITGSVKSKNTFAYSGTVTFNATGTAALVLDNAKYNVNLTTAALTTAN